MRAAIVACAILQRLWSMLSVICVEDRTQNVTTVAALPLGRIANNKMEVIRLNIASLSGLRCGLSNQETNRKERSHSLSADRCLCKAPQPPNRLRVVEYASSCPLSVLMRSCLGLAIGIVRWRSESFDPATVGLARGQSELAWRPNFDSLFALTLTRTIAVRPKAAAAPGEIADFQFVCKTNPQSTMGTRPLPLTLHASGVTQ